MNVFGKQLPEIEASQNPDDVPWRDAVAWSTGEGAARCYHWLAARHVAYVVWSNGNVSVKPSQDSTLSAVLESLVLQGVPVFVGKSVRVC